MDNKGKKIKRRRYFLLNSSQPEMYGKILILVFLTLIVTASIFYMAAHRELEKEWYKAHSTLQYVSDMFLPWLIAANIVGILIVAIYSIFFTHRIAGASFRIQRDLETMRKGDLSRTIRLRSRDQLQDIAQSLNLTLEELRGRMERIAQWASEMEASIEAIRLYCSEGEDQEQAREEAVRLSMTVRRIKEELPLSTS